MKTLIILSCILSGCASLTEEYTDADRQRAAILMGLSNQWSDQPTIRRPVQQDCTLQPIPSPNGTVRFRSVCE